MAYGKPLTIGIPAEGYSADLSPDKAGWHTGGLNVGISLSIIAKIAHGGSHIKCAQMILWKLLGKLFPDGQVLLQVHGIVGEQSGSSISQYFTLSSMKVDPEKLTSEVSGTLHTVVGSKAVTAEPKTFRFFWAYSGLSLQLKGFGMVTKDDAANGGDA